MDKAYYQRHHAELCAKNRAYGLLHREEICVKKKQYYRTHLKERREANLDYSRKHVEEKRVYYKKYNQTHRRQIASRYFKRQYGITIERRDQMFIEQDGKCESCSRPIVLIGHKPNSAVIDHDHKTGEVRGLLCSHCNTAFGFFEEDPKLISGLLTYANKWRKK